LGRLDGKVHDPVRIDFLQRYLRELQKLSRRVLMCAAIFCGRSWITLNGLKRPAAVWDCVRGLYNAKTNVERFRLLVQRCDRINGDSLVYKEKKIAHETHETHEKSR